MDAFELWCWRRLLRVPWTARRSNQSILKEISPGISLEGMMLELKLRYFGHLMWRVDSLEKTVMLGGTGGRRRRGRQDEMAGWHHRLDGRESEWTPGAGDWQGGLASCDSWGRKESDTTEWLNWTELLLKEYLNDTFERSWDYWFQWIPERFKESKRVGNEWVNGLSHSQPHLDQFSFCNHVVGNKLFTRSSLLSFRDKSKTPLSD